LTTGQTAEVLARSELFAGLGEASLTRLAEVCVPRSFAKGRLICSQGETGDCLYVVATGVVKISIISLEGGELVLVTHRPPEVFGEIALVDGGPRSATATALEATTLIALTRTTFEGLLGDRAIVSAVLRYLGGTLRRLTEQTSDFVFLDLQSRVAKLLTGLARERGQATAEGVVLDLGLTQSTLASMVAGSRQSVNQILRSLERRGMIRLDAPRIVVKDLSAG
jgi:CRP-like cAMP-binding protein